LLHPGSKKEEQFIEYLKKKYAERCSEKDKTDWISFYECIQIIFESIFSYLNKFNKDGFFQSRYEEGCFFESMSPISFSSSQFNRFNP